jgi:hypothetical protein
MEIEKLDFSTNIVEALALKGMLADTAKLGGVEGQSGDGGREGEGWGRQGWFYWILMQNFLD